MKSLIKMYMNKSISDDQILDDTFREIIKKYNKSGYTHLIYPAVIKLIRDFENMEFLYKMKRKKIIFVCEKINKFEENKTYDNLHKLIKLAVSKSEQNEYMFLLCYCKSLWEVKFKDKPWKETMNQYNKKSKK